MRLWLPEAEPTRSPPEALRATIELVNSNVPLLRIPPPLRLAELPAIVLLAIVAVPVGVEEGTAKKKPCCRDRAVGQIAPRS